MEIHLYFFKFSAYKPESLGYDHFLRLICNELSMDSKYPANIIFEVIGMVLLVIKIRI